MAQYPAEQKTETEEEEEAPQVEGVEVAREEGGFLGLAIDGQSYVLRFYDAEKQAIEPDVARATARWKTPGKSGRQHTVLNPAGSALRSPAVVRPPHVFRAYITLLSEEGEMVEGHYFDLRLLNQAAPSSPTDETAPASRY